MRVSMPPGGVPAEVIDAALKIHADVMGVRDACADGVPEAVAYGYGAGLADGAAHAVAELATSRPSCLCRCHEAIRFWAGWGDWCDDCKPRHENDLSEVARAELVQLWTDMAWALREAANGKWSIRMESLAHRIGWLSRLVGVAPWTTVETSLLRKEVYQKVHNDVGLEFPPIDWERVAEVERKIR